MDPEKKKYDKKYLYRSGRHVCVSLLITVNVHESFIALTMFFLMTKLTNLNETKIFPFENARTWNVQKIMADFSYQIDLYEMRFGETERSDFDGEFFVPAEVRSRVNSAKGSLRIHGGLLTISRSRTFLSLSNNSKSSIHSSTPDLSRSVPNTPGSNHKISLTSSYDSVLEENEEDGVMVIKKGKAKEKKKNGKSHYSSVQQIFGGNKLKQAQRRKSEDLLESRNSTSTHNVSMQVVNKHQLHMRQGSDQSYRLIPRVWTQSGQSGLMEGFISRNDGQQHAASTSKSTAELDKETLIQHELSPTRWGNVRGSNSFSADLNISALSTYTIPRVTLSQHKVVLNDETTANGSDETRKSLPEDKLSSTFVMRHDTDDSAA